MSVGAVVNPKADSVGSLVQAEAGSSLIASMVFRRRFLEKEVVSDMMLVIWVAEEEGRFCIWKEVVT